MEKFKILGHDVSHEIIYPVYIHHVDLDLDQNTKVGLMDLIEQSCVTDPGKPPRLRGNLLVTQSGNLLKTGNQGIKILSDMFLEITDRLLIQRVGNDVFDFLKPLLTFSTVCLELSEFVWVCCLSSSSLCWAVCNTWRSASALSSGLKVLFSISLIDSST